MNKVLRQEEPKVTIRVRIAWTLATIHFSIQMKDGRSNELDARQTLIWEKRGARWLIVHEHISAPLPG